MLSLSNTHQPPQSPSVFQRGNGFWEKFTRFFNNFTKPTLLVSADKSIDIRRQNRNDEILFQPEKQMTKKLKSFQILESGQRNVTLQDEVKKITYIHNQFFNEMKFLFDHETKETEHRQVKKPELCNFVFPTEKQLPNELDSDSTMLEKYWAKIRAENPEVMSRPKVILKSQTLLNLLKPYRWPIMLIHKYTETNQGQLAFIETISTEINLVKPLKSITA